ncbi:universal stress protein [Candidatus Spongiihabitans sp.]|uniref:universal stress protein n=1 Tax=Candidatus Spongiihabitans sp. TaxID=3101308 RepID=UPI003C7CB7A3
MFKQILAAIDIDHSGDADKILRIAADIANSRSAELHVLSIISAAPVIVSQHLPQSYERMAMERTEQDLAALSASVDLVRGEVTSSARFGDVYREILAHAEKTGVDLIIIGANKPQATDFLLGTNAARVVRHASCSVFVVR